MANIDSLLEKLVTTKPSTKEPKKHLCICELYETGPEELHVTLWDPVSGVHSFSPAHSNIVRKEEEKGRTLAHEIHSSRKIVGCILDYNKWNRVEQGIISDRILKAWEIP